MLSRGRIWILFILCFVLINALIFLIPFDKTANIIVAWAGLFILFIINAYVLRVSMGKRSEKTEAIMIGKKLLKTALMLLAIQLIALAGIAVIGQAIPFWAVLLFEFLLIFISIIILIKTDIPRAVVRKAEQTAAKSTAGVKELRAKAEALCINLDDPANEKALHELADELKYTDPVSNEKTEKLENRINTLLESISHHQDAKERSELIRRAIALVKERAIIAKENK